MNPVEIFGVVVRTAGLLLTLMAFGFLFSAALSATPGPALFGTAWLVIGLWLLRGGRAVVGFAYPEGLVQSR
jgi:hypothetical protein